MNKLTTERIMAMQEVLNEHNVPTEGRFVYMSREQYRDIAGEDPKKDIMTINGLTVHIIH